jgi:hypothetical protein
MLKKAGKMVARLNATAAKVLFTIEGSFADSLIRNASLKNVMFLYFIVKSVALQGISDLSEGSTVGVCFERSGKLATTTEKVKSTVKY